MRTGSEAATEIDEVGPRPPRPAGTVARTATLRGAVARTLAARPAPRTRALLWDGALAVVLGTMLVGEAVAETGGAPGAIVLAGTIGGSLAFRRRFPLGSYLVSCAALLLLAARFYDAGLYPYPNAIGLYSAAAYASRWRAAVALVAGLAGVIFYWTLVPSSDIPWLPGALVGAWALAWVAGRAEVQRRRSAAEALERLAEQERRREADRARAVAQERERLAADVHDIVGHALNVMVLQAGASRRLLDRDPVASADALAVVESVGREALAELDGALELLDTAPTRRPGRGVEDLGELVERFVAAGLAVHLTVTGRPRELPAPVAVAVHRVVQEALTNVAKHAGGARTEVEVAYGDDEVRVRVQDDGAQVGSATGGPPRGSSADRAGAGRGVRGIRERVAALGGAAEIGPDPYGGWTVRCTLRTDR